MGSQLFNDFVVDTNGSCFVCLKAVWPEVNFGQSKWGAVSESPSSSSYSSVHSLSRYLEMDLSKVFHEKGSIPPDLIEDVKRTKLKVSLCEQCRKWNERISELCRQLEKIEMEMGFYLKLVHGSLSLKRNAGDTINPLVKVDDARGDSEGGILEKVRIAKDLRMEALRRCSHKLQVVQPRVKVKKLASIQVNDHDMDQVKEEGPEFLDVNYFEESAELPEEGSVDEGEVKFKVLGVTVSDPLPLLMSHVSNSNHLDVITEPTLSANDHRNVSGGGQQKKKKKRTTKTATKSAAPPSSNSTHKGEELPVAFNCETGKFKCDLCQAEFVHKWTWKTHYETIHLNIKHKCDKCGKLFARRDAYNCHYENAHVGTKFKCNSCGKYFSQKSNLIAHHNAIHLGIRYECKFCTRLFTHKSNLNTHVKSAHPQQQNYKLILIR